MSKIKIIAICGKAGSGKDSILHQLKKSYDVQEIISCTTRPMREGEQDGVNYFYLTNEQFADKLVNNDMLEATVFNDWCYGTMKSSLSKNKWNVGVFNLQGIEILQENPQIDLKIFYIYTPDKLRLLRQLQREDDPNCHEIIRRFSADEKDFQFLELKFNFIQLKNIAQGEQVVCANKIAEICKLARCS